MVEHTENIIEHEGPIHLFKQSTFRIVFVPLTLAAMTGKWTEIRKWQGS